jgi:DNA-binding NarL/FixJ family response regulator
MVDDHEVLREGVKSLLSRLRPEWSICGEAADGEEAIQLAQDLKPDVMILDITMPRVSGLEVSARLRKLGLAFPILIFTTHQGTRLTTDVHRAGAQGYVLKSQAAHDLVLAIDTLMAGGTFFGSSPEPEKKDSPNRGTLLRRISILATS